MEIRESVGETAGEAVRSPSGPSSPTSTKVGAQLRIMSMPLGYNPLMN